MAKDHLKEAARLEALARKHRADADALREIDRNARVKKPASTESMARGLEIHAKMRDDEAAAERVAAGRAANARAAAARQRPGRAAR